MPKISFLQWYISRIKILIQIYETDDYNFKETSEFSKQNIYLQPFRNYKTPRNGDM